MKNPTLLLGLSLLVASAALPAHAAAPVAQVAPETRQKAGEVDDIGAIEEAAPASVVDGKSTVDSKSSEPAKASPFRFSASARGNYTTNARLSGNHASSDFIFFPTLEGSYRAQFRYGFAFEAVARVEAGVYARYDERTFIGYSITNTLEWRPRPNLPRLFIGVEPYRFDGFDGQGRITQAVGTSVGTDYGYGFNNGRSLAFVGYTFTDYLSNPDADSRLNHTVTAGFTHIIRPNLTAQLLYQYVNEFYPTFNDRQDSRHQVGLNLTYQWNRDLFTTLASSFVDSDSTQARASYQSAGVSLGVTYHF